jgi:hypothetical protein
VTTGGSETPVAQPVSEIVAIARAASRRIEHSALDVIGFVRGFEAFGEMSRSLAGAPQREQEQASCGRGSAPTPLTLWRVPCGTTVTDGVDAPRRHRCVEVAVLRDRNRGGVRGNC